MSWMSHVPAGEPALALAVDFLNTYDALGTPPERLSVDLVRRLAVEHGQICDDLEATDLEALRALRERLRPVFAAPTPNDKVAALDAVFQAEAAGVSVMLAEPDGKITLRATGGRDPVGRFGVLIADALARAMATGGPSRFGTCVADPCRCVYVDRTKSARQRYCCELCNDRVAAAAYRRRERPASPGPVPPGVNVPRGVNK
jgi:predicted RNA-binding Zn ribbon-like protein